MNIGSVLTQAAKVSPERTAIIYGDLRRSYRELNARANRLAAQLRSAGLGKGDRVAILQRNCPELLETMFATFKMGAITVPMNARLHPKEAAYILQDSGAKAIVFTDDFVGPLETIHDELKGITTFICIGNAPAWAKPYETVHCRWGCGRSRRASGERRYRVALLHVGDYRQAQGRDGKPRQSTVS